MQRSCISAQRLEGFLEVEVLFAQGVALFIRLILSYTRIQLIQATFTLHGAILQLPLLREEVVVCPQLGGLELLNLLLNQPILPFDLLFDL